MNAPANNTVAVQQPRSVLVDMANRYGMEPQAFELTVRATCSPAPKKGEEFRPLTREEFAAFLLVAREYKLNPLTREIYAYPKRGGGVVPIVSIDGWVNLVNSHPACDGFEFDVEHGDEKGELISMTCRMYRKDRSRPVTVTEYFAECWRDTDPWKMRHRMLRHKTFTQTARYAFGFSGIYDEDEGAKIAEMRDATPPTPPRPNSAPPRPNGSAQPAGEPAKQQPPKPDGELAGKQVEDAEVEDEIPSFDRDTGEVAEDSVDESEAELSPSDMLTLLDDAMQTKTTEPEILELWNEHDLPARLTHIDKGEEFVAVAKALRDRHLKRVRTK